MSDGFYLFFTENELKLLYQTLDNYITAYVGTIELAKKAHPEEDFGSVENIITSIEKTKTSFKSKEEKGIGNRIKIKFTRSEIEDLVLLLCTYGAVFGVPFNKYSVLEEKHKKLLSALENTLEEFK